MARDYASTPKIPVDTTQTPFVPLDTTLIEIVDLDENAGLYVGDGFNDSGDDGVLGSDATDPGSQPPGGGGDPGGGPTGGGGGTGGGGPSVGVEIPIFIPGSVTQTQRVLPDGSTVIDITFQVTDVPGAIKYDVRTST